MTCDSGLTQDQILAIEDMIKKRIKDSLQIFITNSGTHIKVELKMDKEIIDYDEIRMREDNDY